MKLVLENSRNINNKSFATSSAKFRIWENGSWTLDAFSNVYSDTSEWKTWSSINRCMNGTSHCISEYCRYWCSFLLNCTKSLRLLLNTAVITRNLGRKQCCFGYAEPCEEYKCSNWKMSCRGLKIWWNLFSFIVSIDKPPSSSQYFCIQYIHSSCGMSRITIDYN